MREEAGITFLLLCTTLFETCIPSLLLLVEELDRFFSGSKGRRTKLTILSIIGDTNLFSNFQLCSARAKHCFDSEAKSLCADSAQLRTQNHQRLHSRRVP